MRGSPVRRVSYHVRTSISIRMCSLNSGIFVDPNVVPASYEEVKKEMLSELYTYIMDKRNDETIRGSIDVLTPGLNPKLEQKNHREHRKDI